jgi:putative glutamine amidotransferase
MRPLIGISTSEVRRKEQANFARHSEPPSRELALGFSYTEAIERAGGIPVILAPLATEHIDGLLERLQGVCIPGGPDLHPSNYDAEPHPDLGPVEPELDAFELALVRRAQARRLPLLAICRGMQVLNVARGGTLVQHLPDLGGAIDHRQQEVSRVATHAVTVAPGTRLARLLAAKEVQVNSFHHQAIDRLASGLTPTAWSPDGVIEAVESDGSGFTVAVQWHAELLSLNPEQDGIFRGFVEAAQSGGGQAEPAREAVA